MTIKSRPISPPSSKSGEPLQSGFHHLIQHNSSTMYPRGAFSYDDPSQLHNTSLPSYGSPQPIYAEMTSQPRQQPMYTYPNPGQGGGLGISYGSSFGSQYTRDPSPYDMSQGHEQMYHSQFNTPMGSSPPTAMSTPLMSTPGSDSIHTRSGLAVQRHVRSVPESRSRVTKSPKPKKVRKGKAKVENRIARIDQPLSVLTKDWDHVPIIDIEAHVNRPVEVRRKEVENNKGKVKRPSNSFMLYRMAYQLRIKAWYLENNHQVVSQVCGDSWRLELDEVKEQFNEWSKIERTNHHNANPGYKFTPSKPGAKTTKRQVSVESESEESELDDYDWEKGQTRKSRKPQRSNPRPAEVVQRPLLRSPYTFSRESSIEPGVPSHNKSSYQMNNPGRPAPMPYNQAQLENGHYYQQSVHGSLAIPGAEEVVIRKTPTPGMHYPGMSEDNGYDMVNDFQLEEDPEYDIMNDYQLQIGSLPAGQMLHPSLMAPANTLFSNDYFTGQGLYPGESLEPVRNWDLELDLIDPELQNNMVYMDTPQQYDTLQLSEQHMQRLNNSHEGWQIEPLDPGQEFDKWIEEDERTKDFSAA